MRYGPLFPYAGARPLQEYFLGANDTAAPDWGAGYNGPGSAPPTMPNGCIVPGFDNYWGGVEFQYCIFQTAVPPWTPCIITPTLAGGRMTFVASAVPNTANQSRPIGIAIANMAAGQYGWVAKAGLVPIVGSASVAAANSVGITAAGQLGASSAGKEIEGAVSILPATTTVVKNNATTLANSPIVQFTGNNTIDGLFIGCALSGTNIPANAVVQTIDPDGRRITMSTGPGVGGAALNASGSGGVAITATYNDGTNFYNIIDINRPFVQGRIT
jgi:hypothetical protein